MNDITYQEELDATNKDFWNELCGTHLAKHLGVNDSSIESLAKFDNFFLDYYPYVKKHIDLEKINGQRVLEVGLGYGTVGQMLAQAGANYHALDIAFNAVQMTKHRLMQNNLQGDLRQGSMITCPFPDNYFDFVISIGCFHHTGNMQECVNQTHRILKNEGKALIMVYNKFSLRQWKLWPLQTTKDFLNEFLVGKSNASSIESQRKAYDASEENQVGAPVTEFFSQKKIRHIFRNFETIKITKENFDEGFTISLFKIIPLRFKSRSECLNSYWTRHFGLDLYIEVTK
ncbi:MAG: class I SAM-dependent methyltransferase [Gammaproteobacteria bacterium]|jgi:ubiquinone/menaquinone biosynthesis C-methylase UbiE|nr:class I SAM-dependent methyltransferase [Gammaproteobacteria bacterium]